MAAGHDRCPPLSPSRRKRQGNARDRRNPERAGLSVRGARMAPASGSGYVPLHSGVDSQLSGSRGRRAATRAARIHGRARDAAPRGIDGDSYGYKVRLTPDPTDTTAGSAFRRTLSL